MTSRSRLAVVGCLAVHASALVGQVTTAQYGNARTGWAANETLLTPRNVASSTFGKIATLSVDGDVYAQPLYLPRVNVVGAGTHDLVIVATQNNSVYAFDAATHSPTPLWRASLNGGPGHTPLAGQDVRCPFLRPDVGITPTPVIDTVAGAIFVLARTKYHTGGKDVFEQHLHALDLHTGKDKLAPVRISAGVPGRGDGAHNGRVDFDPLRENPRAALLLANGVVYLSWASSCDVGPYHGWVMAYDAATLSQRAVFNASPDGGEAGIWQGDAGLASDSAGHVYAVTGNGTFDESPAHRRNYGNTVLALALRDTSLVVHDFFTPSNQAALSAADEDLGSTGAVLLPDQPGAHRRLLVITGKDGTTYLIDRDAMGGYNSAGGSNRGIVQALRTSKGGFGAAAYWKNTVYVWGSSDVLKAYALTGGRLALQHVGPTRVTDPGATPVVSSNGNRDGIVWAIETRTWNGADKAAVLHAYDASDVRHELFNSEMSPTRDRPGPATRFAFPTVAAGRVYVGTKGEVDVYGLIR